MSSPLGDPDMRVSFSTLQRRVKELERRRTAGRPTAPPRTLAELEDVDITGVSDAEVLTYDGDLEKWVRGTVPASTPGITSQQDTGTIDYSTGQYGFNYQTYVTVNPMSLYVVTVTGKVLDNRQVKICDDPVIWVPAPWQLTAYDETADPGPPDYQTGNMGSGFGVAQCTLLAANDTEEAVGHLIVADMYPLPGPAGFEDWDTAADVEISIRSENFY